MPAKRLAWLSGRSRADALLSALAARLTPVTPDCSGVPTRKLNEPAVLWPSESDMPVRLIAFSRWRYLLCYWQHPSWSSARQTADYLRTVRDGCEDDDPLRLVLALLLRSGRAVMWRQALPESLVQLRVVVPVGSRCVGIETQLVETP